jgi:hypothetical protein
MTVLRIVIGAVLFLMGGVTLLIGLGVILSREYMEALRNLTRESSHLGAKAAQDAAFLPILDGASRLVESVTRMVQTAVGVGAFLCLLGAGLCALAYWILGGA